MPIDDYFVQLKSKRERGNRDGMYIRVLFFESLETASRHTRWHIHLLECLLLWVGWYMSPRRHDGTLGGWLWLTLNRTSRSAWCTWCRWYRLRMTAQKFLQLFLVLGGHVMENGFVDPLLVIELGASLFFQIDMGFAQDDFQIPALRGHPTVQEIGRVISEPEQEIAFCLGVVHALNVLHDLFVLGMDLFG